MEAEQVSELVVRFGIAELHGSVPVDGLRLPGREFFREGALRRL